MRVDLHHLFPVSMRLPLCLAPLIVSCWLAQPVSAMDCLLEQAPAEKAGLFHPAHCLKLAEIPTHSSVPIPPTKALPESAQSVLRFLPEPGFLMNPEWWLTGGALLASGAFAWGVGYYGRQQQWQRIEFLRRAVKEFEQEPEIRNALKILDFEEYRDYFIEGNAERQRISFRVDDELLCNALAPHDERARQKQKLDYCQDHDTLDPQLLRQYQIETTLRDWFNKMLNGLEHFGYFLESGLFSEKELQPWLSYWIKLIAEPTYRRQGSSKFYNALYSYIHHSGFFGVQRLFERFGYRILPSPYLDTDLVKLALAAPGYSTQRSLLMAKAAYLAYQDKQFVAEVIGRWGAALKKCPNSEFIRHDFRYFNNRGRDTQAYIVRTDQFMLLAFRGSQQPKDWLTNLATQLCSFTIQKDGVASASSYKGRVHTGFFLAWAIIEPAVLAQIASWRKNFADSGKLLPPIYITGHSLGGALATVAAAALAENNIEVAGVYTFGQPRVGDRTFAKQLSLNTGGKIFRFVNNNDMVPHVPPPFSVWNPTRLYGHVGTATYFDGKGLLIATGSYRLGSRLIDAFVGFTKGVFGSGFGQITDHRMEYYISHLDEALKTEIENEAVSLLEVG
jgi:hypothetical protein